MRYGCFFDPDIVTKVSRTASTYFPSRQASESSNIVSRQTPITADFGKEKFILKRHEKKLYWALRRKTFTTAGLSNFTNSIK